MNDDPQPPKRPRKRRGGKLANARGAVELAGGSFDQLTQRIHQFHRAISDIPFDSVEKAPVAKIGAQPTRAVHDSITDNVYATVRTSGALLFGLASKALKAVERETAPTAQAAAEQGPGHSAEAPQPTILRDNLLSAVNGAFGDTLAARRNPLSVAMAFHHHGAPLDLDAASLRAAQPALTPKLAIFIHGLCCNEHSWRMYHDAARPETLPYGDRLAAEHGWTPFYLRYNTGLHISSNGRALSRLIAKLLAAYPLKVEEIALIGHSMGGLVARGAAHYGADTKSGQGWTQAVSHIVCLGTPHLGAPLEQVVHAGTALMDSFKLSRPWGELLKLRSLGIKDLRHGYAHHSDWRGHHPDSNFENRRSDIPRLESARYHFIGSSIGATERDWIGKTLGDGLVRLPSSTAHELAEADTATLFGLHHMRLLNDPAVYAELSARLASPTVESNPKPVPKKKHAARKRSRT